MPGIEFLQAQSPLELSNITDGFSSNGLHQSLNFFSSHRPRGDNERISDIRNILAGINNPSGGDSQSPATSYSEMLDTSTGTFKQRLVKWCLKPQGEKFTQVMDFLQVKSALAKIVARRVKTNQLSGDELTNYSLGRNRSDLGHLINMATDLSWKAEKFHLIFTGIALPGVIVGLGTIASGGVVPLVISSVFVSANTYLALAQIYTRTRLAHAIDRKIQRGDKLRADYQGRHLALRLPPQELDRSSRR